MRETDTSIIYRKSRFEKNYLCLNRWAGRGGGEERVTALNFFNKNNNNNSNKSSRELYL